MDKVGFEGFLWFFGLVEDVDDPLKVGRVKVRIYNVHSFDEARVRKEDLPWAHVITPVTSASFNEKGVSPVGLLVNSTVFGFFADGAEQQKPIILGSLPGIPQPDPSTVDPNNIKDDNHDVSRLARGINKLATVKNDLRSKSGVESFEPPPENSYRAQYPHNKVFETPNGLVVELDDTPNAQRIHIWHPGGSYTEINNSYTIHKTNGTEFQICAMDKQVKVKGDYILDIEGNYTVNATGDIQFKTGRSYALEANVGISTKSNLSTTMFSGGYLSTTTVGYTTMSAGAAMSLQSGLAMSLKAGAALDVTVAGAITVQSGAATAFVSGLPFIVSAPQIYLN